MTEKKQKSFLKAGMSISVAIILLFTVIPSMALGNVDITDKTVDGKKITETYKISFPIPTITEDSEGYVNVQVEGTDSETLIAGEPNLPKKVMTIDLPLGSMVDNVEFARSSVETMYINDDTFVTPAPVPVPMVDNTPITPILRNTVQNVVINFLLKIANRLPVNDYTDIPLADSFNEDIYESSDEYGESFSYEVLVGLNHDGDLSTIVNFDILPCTYYPADSKLEYFTDGDISLTYTLPDDDPHPIKGGEDEDEEYDLLILAPIAYIQGLQKLVDHKEEMGFRTKLVSLNEIYNEKYFEMSDIYNRDSQEKIKYFIYNAILNWSVKYVLAVGGYRTFLGLNVPSVQFPVRYSHLEYGEPGYACDQYYSACMKYDHGGDCYVFDSWDSNENGIFAEWNPDSYDAYDESVDVNFGRLACRNTIELEDVIDKIIYYELNTYGEDWFNNMILVCGDGFQDMNYRTDIGFVWDISDVEPGRYTIAVQSCSAKGCGPTDRINITVDPIVPSVITFGEDDHLKIVPQSEEQTTTYPGKPVADIVIPQENDILGNTDVDYQADAAYGTDLTDWGHAFYKANDRIIIRSKSYDPKFFDGAYVPGGDDHGNENRGSYTTLKIWIKDSEGNLLSGFPQSHLSKVFYEGDVAGQRGLDFMPDFNHIVVSTSKGDFNNMSDVLSTWSEGSGFMYFEGHSSAMTWMNHYPGIPGGRGNGGVAGLATINLKFNPLDRYAAKSGDPLLPIDQLENGNKLPIVLFSGCHSGQYDCSLMKILFDPESVLFGSGYASWTPEGMAWWMTRIPQGGAIACMGNSGLGYGYLGSGITTGLVGWLYPRFFYNYNVEGMDILGDAFTQTVNDYGSHFDVDDDIGVRKHWEQFVLLGDPTLKIGGYPLGKEASYHEEDDDRIEPIDATIGDIITVCDSDTFGRNMMISSNFTNSGTMTNDFDWNISIDGMSPLGQFLGGGDLVTKLLAGRIWFGGFANDSEYLEPTETSQNITSGAVYGFGHIMVNVTVSVNDELIDYKTEDGFILFGRMFLYHGEE